jgi:hypothetical protein
LTEVLDELAPPILAVLALEDDPIVVTGTLEEVEAWGMAKK